MGINLQRLTHEIHEMQQLHKTPENSNYAASMRVFVVVDVNT